MAENMKRKEKGRQIDNSEILPENMFNLAYSVFSANIE